MGRPFQVTPYGYRALKSLIVDTGGYELTSFWCLCFRPLAAVRIVPGRVLLSLTL